MAEEHLILMVANTYKKLPFEERAVKIRKLCRQSSDTREFIKNRLPDLYREAYPNGHTPVEYEAQ
jgi:hypothetical protein